MKKIIVCMFLLVMFSSVSADPGPIEYHKIQGGHIYYRDGWISEGADTFSKVDLGPIDTASYTMLNRSYPAVSKDKSNVYCVDKIEKDIDASTFVNLQGRYYKDKKFVYERCEKITNIDPETVKIEGNNLIDKNGVYEMGSHKLIEGIDGNTLEQLLYGYSKDKFSVYYRNEIMPNIDVGSFEVLKNGYVKDKDNVYGNLKTIENKTIKTTRNTLLNGADAETFEVISSSFAMDKNYIYSTHRDFFNILQKNNPDTLTRKIGPEANKDRVDYLTTDDSVYYSDGTKIEDADPETFEYVEKGYVKDKNYVYYQGEVVKGMSPDDLHVTDNSAAEALDSIFSEMADKKNENTKTIDTADFLELMADNNRTENSRSNVISELHQEDKKYAYIAIIYFVCFVVFMIAYLINIFKKHIYKSEKEPN